MDSTDSAFTVEEVATRLGVSERSVWRRIRAGDLATVHTTRPDSAGRGRTYVTAASLERATAGGTKPRVMEPDGTPNQTAPVSGHGTELASQVVAQLATSVADLSATVAPLTAQLAAADSERRELVAQLAAIQSAPRQLTAPVAAAMPVQGAQMPGTPPDLAELPNMVSEPQAAAHAQRTPTAGGLRARLARLLHRA